MTSVYNNDVKLTQITCVFDDYQWICKHHAVYPDLLIVGDSLRRAFRTFAAGPVGKAADGTFAALHMFYVQPLHTAPAPQGQALLAVCTDMPT
jgi:hypothetical protein